MARSATFFCGLSLAYFLSGLFLLRLSIREQQSSALLDLMNILEIALLAGFGETGV